MTSTERLYQILKLRRAFIEGATSGKFPMNQVRAERLAAITYPIVETKQRGELPEIAEALRVPIPEPIKEMEGEDVIF